MNGQIKSLLASFSIVFILLSAFIAKAVVLPMGSITLVLADGDGGTEAGCLNPTAGSVTNGTDSVRSYTVPVGNIVTGVCIKSGSNMFLPLKHSGILSNGSYENGCYTVTGVGTQTVTVTKNFGGSSCQGISHIDVFYSDPGQSPSPSPSASPSVSPSPSASPSTKPSQSPSASPSTKPSDDPSSEPSQSPSTEPSESPRSEVSPSPSASASPSPSTEASSTPTPTPSSTPGTDSGVGGGEISDPGQVLGLSTTSGNYALNSALVFVLGIISTSAGLFFSRKKAN